MLNKKLEEEFLSVPVDVAEIVKMRFGLGVYDRPLSSKEISCIVGFTRQGVEKKIKKFFDRNKINFEQN